MKQHHLSTKFLRFYILIGILGFFLITLGGSYMVEKHLEHSLSAALYTEAHKIASNEAVKSNISSSTVDTLQEHLCAISDFQDAVLWIINSNFYHISGFKSFGNGSGYVSPFKVSVSSSLALFTNSGFCRKSMAVRAMILAA